MHYLNIDLQKRLDERIERYEQMFDKKVTNKEKVSILATEGFQIGLVTYLILLLLETIKEGFVSYFFNMNYLLGFVLIAGIIMVLTTNEKKKKEEVQPTKLTSWNWQFMFLMSFGGGSLVYYKTADLGGLSLIISLLAMIIIFLLSYLIYTDTE